MDFFKLIFPSGPFYLRVNALKNITHREDGSLLVETTDGKYVEVPEGFWQTGVFMTLEEVWADLNA